MIENNYRIIPTSPDGHEYFTELGRPQTITGDNKCFLCVFLKARDVCHDVFLDRFPNNLTDLVNEFYAGASTAKTRKKFLRTKL